MFGESHQFLKNVTTQELCAEIARRFNVLYGKIQMTFHAGKPSEYMNLDLKVSTQDEKPEKTLKVVNQFDRPALNIKI